MAPVLPYPYTQESWAGPRQKAEFRQLCGGLGGCTGDKPRSWEHHPKSGSEGFTKEVLIGKPVPEAHCHTP